MSDPLGVIKRLTLDDVDSVLGIQRDCYGEGYLEDSRTFTGMISVYPQGCLGAWVNGFLAAYVFFHPYLEGVVKPLDHYLALDRGEDCMYVHDLAVLPRFQGEGLAGMLMERVDQGTKNEGFDIQCLVAVQDSRAFWSRFGFEEVKQVESYGGSPAHYMRRSL